MFNGIAFNTNEDRDIKSGGYYAEKIKKNKIKRTCKESSFKSIIEDIKRGLYYVQEMNNLSTSDIKKSKKNLLNLKTNYLIIIARLKKILLNSKVLNIFI